MKKLFIVGVARTGSKVYTNFLNQSKECNIALELQFKVPRLIRKDVSRMIKSVLPDFSNKRNVSKLSELLVNYNFPKTSFFSERNYTKSDLIKLFNEISESKITEKHILQVLIEAQASAKNKKIAGAKFPVNIACFGWLYQNFSDAYYLNIIRDPRAIYVSMFLKDKKEKAGDYYLKMFFFRTSRLLYLIYQY